MSATLSGETAGRLSRAVARRAWACSWWPRRCSTPAHAAVSLPRSPIASSGTIARPSSSAAWLSANWPVVVSAPARARRSRSEEHTSELQSHSDLVCRLLLEKKKNSTDGGGANVFHHYSAI